MAASPSSDRSGRWRRLKPTPNPSLAPRSHTDMPRARGVAGQPSSPSPPSPLPRLVLRFSSSSRRCSEPQARACVLVRARARGCARGGAWCLCAWACAWCVAVCAWCCAYAYACCFLSLAGASRCWGRRPPPPISPPPVPPPPVPPPLGARGRRNMLTIHVHLKTVSPRAPPA